MKEYNKISRKLFNKSFSQLSSEDKQEVINEHRGAMWLKKQLATD